MMTSRVMLLAVCAIVATTCVMGAVLSEDNSRIEDDAVAGQFTALQEYVNTADANYEWTRISEYDEQGLGYKVLWLNMTSQQWLTANDTDRSIWWHFVAVIVPNNLNSEFADRGLMYMTGGQNHGTPPKVTSEDLIVGAVLAQTCQVVVTVLFQLPNAPIKFYSEKPVPLARTEDALIAYGWAQYLKNTNEPQYLARLPMTKAGLRAMDAVTEFWEQESGSTMEKWIVAGASKRGWTAWTVAACDPERVIGLIPLVLDELNFVKNIHHHWRAYGGWSFFLRDYVAQNITTQLDTEEFALAMEIVDPIVYASILTMPKLIISTGGDEFLMPDNNDWYWSQLEGEKHFHQFPNLEHTMIENIPLVLDTVHGFVIQLLTNTTRPEYTWTKEANGNLHVEISANNPPSSVEVWSATTIDGNERRDFRLLALNQTSGKPELHPVFWYSKTLAPTTNTSTLITYDALLEAPAEGWIGFNIQLVFPGPLKSNFRVSTATSILPETFPYPDCYLETCSGAMV